MKKKKESTVEVVVDLGALTPLVKRMARSWGVSVNEFICNALESKVREDRDRQSENFTPHGGKHLFGKHTGYEVTKDGKYYVAPQWAQSFEQLFAERVAIHSLVNSVIDHSNLRLMDVEKQIGQAKDRLIDDLGLDASKSWVYYGGEKCIAEAPKEKDTEK